MGGAKPQALGSACVSHAGSGVPPERTLDTVGYLHERLPYRNRGKEKVRFGETPKPALGTSALPVREAAGHVTSWLSQPHVKVTDILRQEVESALTLLQAAGTAGNLTTDAQIAAIALRLDADVHTADLDFARFRDVRFLNPLD